MRIRKYIPILLPLIINSIRRSLELAEAMESRAFGATSDRTNLYELRMSGKDYAVLVVVLLALASVFYIKYVFPLFRQLLPPGTLI